MKNKFFTLVLFLFTLPAFFAQKQYDLQWKKVSENYKTGKFKSNLPLISEIQNQAMKEDNPVQLMRSLKAEFSIINQTYDDIQNDTSSKFFTKLNGLDAKLKGDEKFLYQVLLVEFFNDYYNENQWQINQRTNINNQDFSQIETWSKLDFKNYLAKHFTDLELKKSELQKISMSKYKEIFEGTENLDYFPTLLDWNATNEIKFYNNSQLFTPNEKKVNQSKILGIYNELISKNSGNAKLYFQHQKINDDCAFSNCKDKIQQLQNLVKSSTEGDYKVLIIAEILDQLTADQKYNEALLLIKNTKQEYSKSKFLNNILNRENSILQPSLSINYETHTQANLPIHLVVDAKNVSKFSLNIYEVKDDQQNFLKYIANSYDKTRFPAVKKTLVRKESFDLQDLKDYKNHKTSLEIKSLPSGIYLAEYVVENSIQENFYFIATNSRIIFNKKDERKTSDDQLQIVNRENGKAVSNENLKIFEFTNDNKANSFTAKTDQSAIFKFPVSKDNQYYRYYLVQQPSTNDYNLMQVYGNQYYNEPKTNGEKNLAQIFIDRGIYRPGQIVYFKVINTKLLLDKESVASGISQEITLNDANGEKISSQKFTTNEFGSYHGSFTLPNGKLNGQFSLEVESDDLDRDATKYFRVEEYKRPKFEVTFDPIKEEYKYGQTIELKGKAMMFSGVALSNATVNYEIKKQNIRWRYFWWFPRGNDNQNSILGEVKTNDKGEFIIKLDLKKDETLEGIQVDNYEINASVTDINGETQSSTENVKVASVSHYIKTDDIKDTFTDEPLKITVETKNYNDQNLKKSYHVKLSKLQPKERIYRSNFESQIQDLPKFSNAEFIQKFPHDYFSKEEKDWKVEKILIEKTEQPSTDNSQLSTNLNLGKLAAGNYKLELYNIEGKDTIKIEKTFEVFDKRFLADSQKPYLKVLQPKAEFKRTEKAKIFIYSGIPDALINVYVQNGNGETLTEQKKFKNGILEYEVSFPKDESIDQINVQFQLVAFNDVQTQSVNLTIASDKKPLRIETVTFRDKLQPGQKEKWTVKVLGEDKEKINAEVLANMYDKSLDQFASNSFSFRQIYQKNFILNSYGINENLAQENFNKRVSYLKQKGVNIPYFNWFDGRFGGDFFTDTVSGVQIDASKNVNIKIRGAASPTMQDSTVSQEVQGALGIKKKISALTGKVSGIQILTNYEINEVDFEKIPVRQNLNETAFFYPNLMTDKDGNVTFEFTSPEALTQWKLMFLAHTKDARSATLEKSVITQKEFSVTPNYPRFLREGDKLNLQSKLSSLVEKKLSGVAQLQILDAFTNEDISSKFNLDETQKSFELAENGNSVVNWKLKVPNDVSSMIIKIVAKAGNFSDGEQKAIAVLPNRMLVTDAVPIFVKEGQTKTFTLENLAKYTSNTATNFSNTLELTTNPIWEIMFALPSLKNDQNNSADVIFNKWFADVLASEIFKANPKLKTVFEEYQSKGLLASNLEKNQELKQLLLEETPWVLESKNETEQMEKLARLFDANNMRNSINEDWSELQKLQNPDGGFSWYQGYPSSYYNSLYILKNLGKVNEWLKGNTADYQSSEQKEMVAKLINYVDSEVFKYWDVKKEYVWNNYVLDYLDTRNYWKKDFPLKGKGAQLKTLVIQKAPKAEIKDFTFFGLHRAALLFNDYKLPVLSKKLLTYLKETSTESETQGIYWKQNLNDWGWYNSKTVNHAGALEAFNKLTPNDTNFIEEMKIWLITQKEVNSWGSSRGTAEVIFTILNSGKSWTSNESDKATIIWGGKELTNPDTKATGYVKSTLKEEKIDKNLGTVTVTKPGPGIVQGGLFWQYYEDLDKIKSSESYLSIIKELYKKVKTVNGEELVKIAENSPLKVGDKVTVRMILNTDRNMEFIHLKDMRAAGFEPLNIISGYEWKNGLGYYQSTKDASTNFYIENMPKGKYVFEYDYICNASGMFSNGITTLQNYYAPQMNAHTKGTKITITE
ncbi:MULTISPECIES: alpha-2-macroglobulin [unclassified Kaistella]|uniref:alpha-2-macroglobulin family protein n=1 Tax=unclassified Kaistella TaxID=2762626 RepID=UPI0027373E96|nr:MULTISPECIES: MG2 domain-containing protein [unclassified Kaistella]MDP2454595.1 MG2 domain-containing protein [Kaistella sp. SH11-4b]MDP2457332.1 MG2 domain-containing protein [Kaistella sp. SH40-3]MDP2460092.1 MG2 domain-containing protein [Kaistella sp. SH19-2b]